MLLLNDHNSASCELSSSNSPTAGAEYKRGLPRDLFFCLPEPLMFVNIILPKNKTALSKMC